MTLPFTLSGPDRRLLAAGKRRGATKWLIAIQMFVMVVVSAAGLAIGNAAAVLGAATDHQYSLQLAGGGDRSAELAEAARALDGVEQALAIPEAEVRATLDRWLGAAADEADLPVPAIVELTLADGVDVAAIETALTTQFDGATLTSNRTTIAPLLRSLQALGWVSAFIVLLVALAAGAAVVLASRAALAANQDVISVMHGVGATDEQVARLFQYRIATDSLVGGLMGAGVAALVLALVATTGLAIAGRMAGQALLTPLDVILLALLPLVGALLATMVARQAVLAALRERP
ncbi:cell division protein FtsX [Sphingomicrobium flavum]|uniref:cell division protein FtsX n=1 Tax=Sphingomicrobium flavum TaxID=1229164 RepID=UPI0021AD9E42|nr:FtsX-like permease family protein [Sphingomicrobium flavum]